MKQYGMESKGKKCIFMTEIVQVAEQKIKNCCFQTKALNKKK